MPKPLGVQLFVGGAPRPELIQPTRNRPSLYSAVALPAGGGFWTSTWNEKERSSDWLDFCRVNGLRYLENSERYLLTVDRNARVYHVDSVKDLDTLFAICYGAQVEVFRLTQHYPVLDYEKLAERYDGIHLTKRGQRRTRHSEPNFYGWDCECTYWFRWSFTIVRGAPYKVAC